MSGEGNNKQNGTGTADEGPLKFPTDYPIKVMGKVSDELRARVHAVMLRHDPGLDPDRVSERLSSEGTYLSITYVITAVSREQIVALVNDLKTTEGVLQIL